MAKGKKNCPKCNKIIGARTRKCDCGFEFTPSAKRTTKTKKVKRISEQFGEKEISPGLWVYDIPKGMPRVSCPGSLPNGKIDKQELYDYISYNGLGDCIFSIVPSGKIEDIKLKEKWKKAKRAMDDVWLEIIGN